MRLAFEFGMTLVIVRAGRGFVGVRVAVAPEQTGQPGAEPRPEGRSTIALMGGTPGAKWLRVRTDTLVRIRREWLSRLGSVDDDVVPIVNHRRRALFAPLIGRRRRAATASEAAIRTAHQRDRRLGEKRASVGR